MHAYDIRDPFLVTVKIAKHFYKQINIQYSH